MSGPTEDAASLLDLLRRTNDEGYLQGLLDDPDSAVIQQAQIAMMARLGVAVVHDTDNGLILSASGGSPGTATLTVTRAAGGTTGTIPKGYPFIDDRGVKLVLALDVPVGSGVTTLALPLQTLRQSELVNTEDDANIAVDPSALTIPSSSGILIAPAGTGGVSSTTFQTIGPSTQITGGAVDWLSQHGAERGLPRQPGEDTASYRQRIRNVPDAVSPIAIADVVQAEVQQAGLPPTLVLEPFEDGATPALKALHGLGSFSGIAWDVDSRDDTGAPFVVLDRRTVTAYFLIQAQAFITDAQGFGVFWDTMFFDDPVLGYPEGDDVFPPVQLASLLALQSDVAAKKAGAVNFDIELKGDDLVQAGGSRTANTFGEVVTLTPAAGQIWYLSQVLAGHDSPTPSSAIAHHLTFDLDDGSSFTTADFNGTWTEMVPLPTRPVIAIHAFLKSDGTIAAHLWVAARVLSVTAP